MLILDEKHEYIGIDENGFLENDVAANPAWPETNLIAWHATAI